MHLVNDSWTDQDHAWSTTLLQIKSGLSLTLPDSVGSTTHDALNESRFCKRKIGTKGSSSYKSSSLDVGMDVERRAWVDAILKCNFILSIQGSESTLYMKHHCFTDGLFHLWGGGSIIASKVIVNISVVNCSRGIVVLPCCYSAMLLSLSTISTSFEYKTIRDIAKLLLFASQSHFLYSSPLHRYRFSCTHTL